MNRMHEANRTGWDAVSPVWQARIEQRGQVAPVPPGSGPCPGTAGRLRIWVRSPGGTFAFWAAATTLWPLRWREWAPESHRSIFRRPSWTGAASRAGELGLEIAFLRADVIDLGLLGDEKFDLVYTGGHVAVWVSDLRVYYAEACRILRRGGTLMVCEYHPFRRVWRQSPDRLTLEYGYFERGPHEYDRSDDVPDALPGSLPSYEFHWTVADYVAALMDGGSDLVALEEFGDLHEQWESAPLAGLPNSLLLVGCKR